MGNSVSLRVWSEHDDDVIVNSPFLRRNRRTIPTIIRTEEDSSSSGSTSSSSSSHSSSSSSEDTIALSAGSTSSLNSLNKEPSTEPSSEKSIISSTHLTRQCWICYGEEDVPERESVTFNARWVSPCACKGTTKWVHQSCVLDWIDSQLRAGSTTVPLRSGTLVIEDAQLACPQCHVPYRLHQAYALPRPLLHLLDLIAGVKERMLIYSTLGLASSAIYTLAFSHGFWSGWMLGGSDFLDWIHQSSSSTLARLQVSAAVPMIPLYALSLTFPGMSGWLYPLTPLLVYEPGMSMRSVRGFMMTAPLVLLVGRKLFGRVFGRGNGDDSEDDLLNREELDNASNNALNTLNTLDTLNTSSTLNTSNASSPTTTHTHTAPSTPALSQLSTSPPTLRISILSTTGALLFPASCSLLGRLLCRVGSLTGLSVFQKSLVGAGVLMGLKMAVELVYWYQQVHLKRYRRVLDRPEE